MITLDIMTRWLEESIQNLNQFEKETITAMFKSVVGTWYNQEYRRELRTIFETGKKMPPMKQSYLRWKQAHMGRSFRGRSVISIAPLKFTGEVEKEVMRVQPTYKVTRGKELRMYVRYNKPFYIGFLHDGHTIARGGGRVPARPFIKVAKDSSMRKLIMQLTSRLKRFKLSQPTASFRSSLVTPEMV